MKLKVTLLAIVGLLVFTLWGCAKKTAPSHMPSPSSRVDNIFYTIYYGKLDELPTSSADLSKYKLIIIKALEEEGYHNIAHPKAYKTLQRIRNSGVEVFIHLNIGRSGEDSYMEAADKEGWLTKAKENISLYLLYADGIFLDKAGGPQSQPVTSGIKELTDLVHTRGGQVIISDLADTFQAQIENPLAKHFLPGDYYLLENCWISYTGRPKNPQYKHQNVPEQMRIIKYGQENKAKILGLSWGDLKDTEKIRYVYFLSKIVDLAGICYSSPVWEHQSNLYQPDIIYSLGKPLGSLELKKEVYTRQYEGGTIYVDPNTHHGWIKR